MVWGLKEDLFLKSREMSDKAVEILEGKKARDLNVIDITEVSILADYFIICSGSSSIQVKAIADEIYDKLTECGFSLYHKEGYETAKWILLDYGDVIIHIFHEEDRSFYNLERLWADAEVINY
jgi:ribosome-associated protein